MGLNMSVMRKANANNQSALDTSNDSVVINKLDESTYSDMMSVGGQSMAGVSDRSGGGVQRVGAAADQSMVDVSMYSASDVNVMKQEQSVDDINASMAGLSDVSLADVQRVNAQDDSMADVSQNMSMASLNDDSMAGVSFTKPTGTAGRFDSAQTKDDTDSSQGNILDSLKI